MDAPQCMLQQCLLYRFKAALCRCHCAVMTIGSYLSGSSHGPSIGHGGRTVLALSDTVCRLQTRLLYSEWALCCASPGPICSKTLCSSHTMRHCVRV